MRPSGGFAVSAPGKRFPGSLESVRGPAEAFQLRGAGAGPADDPRKSAVPDVRQLRSDLVATCTIMEARFPEYERGGSKPGRTNWRTRRNSRKSKSGLSKPRATSRHSSRRCGPRRPCRACHLPLRPVPCHPLRPPGYPAARPGRSQRPLSLWERQEVQGLLHEALRREADAEEEAERREERPFQGRDEGPAEAEEGSRQGRTGTVFQLKITLNDIRPPIWRRVQTKDCTLAKLHDIIQVSMGWQDSHLHLFEIGEDRYGDLGQWPKDYLDELETLNERKSS